MATVILYQTAVGLDWGAIFQQAGPVGIVILVAADFIFNQVRVSRMRVNMEKTAEDRLNDSNRKIIELMDARLAERDSRISELQEENRGLRGELAESNGEVKNLSGRLDWTNTQLVEARAQAALVPGLGDQVGSLTRQLDKLSSDLVVERDLREKAELKADNLQIFYNRLEDDNQSLIQKNSRLGKRLDEQAEQMTRLEEDRRHLSDRLSQMMAGVKDDDLQMDAAEVGADDRRHSNTDTTPSSDVPVSG